MTGQDQHLDDPTPTPQTPPAAQEEEREDGGGAADMLDGDDDEVDRNVKKFLCHKEVLDTLRLYLDPDAKTVNRLLRAGVISMQQRDNILGRCWPMNRNELMQLLVRRSWDSNSFNGFLEVVKHTQKPRLTQTLGVLLRKDRSEEEKEDQQFDHPLKELLKVESTDSVLQRLQNATIDAKTKSMIQKLLRSREDEVTAARMDLSALRAKVAELETANLFLQGQMAAMETSVADVVADVVKEGIYHDSHEGLRAILREVEKLSTSLKENKATIEQLEAEKKRWTHANSLLTTQNIHMREDRLQLKKRLEDLTQRTSAEIASLKNDLKNEKAAGLKLYSQLTLAKEEHQVALDDLEDTSRTLERTERSMEAAVRSRDTTQAELKAVDQRVRKLLKILGMSDDKRLLSQAVEHAGNLLLVRRRRDRQLDRRGLSRGPGVQEEDDEDSVFWKEPDTNNNSHRRALPRVSYSTSVSSESGPSKITTQELHIPSAPAATSTVQRRTSVLGLPRSLNILTAADPAPRAKRRESIILLSPNAAVAKSDSVVLPHIRRRSSVAWKLKTDLHLGGHLHSVPQEGDEMVGSNQRVRKTSMFMKPMESTPSIS